jgi:hypothetical protein
MKKTSPILLTKENTIKHLDFIEYGKLYSFLLYIISLVTPVSENNLGFTYLAIGWMGIADPEFIIFSFVPWLSNLTYFITLFCPRELVRIRIAVSGTTAIFSLFSIGFFLEKSSAPSIGFYLWISSYLTIFIHAILLNRISKK